MKIGIERESDGRWIAEISELPGVMAYGDSRSDAVAKAETLALRVTGDRNVTPARPTDSRRKPV